MEFGEHERPLGHGGDLADSLLAVLTLMLSGVFGLLDDVESHVEGVDLAPLDIGRDGSSVTAMSWSG